MRSLLLLLLLALGTSLTATGFPESLCPGLGADTPTIRGRMNVGSEYKIEYRNLTDNGIWKSRRGRLDGNLCWTLDQLRANKEYKVRVKYLAYRSRWQEYASYHVWTVCNRTVFTLNGVGNGTVTTCGEDALTINAAASRDETGYGVAIREIGPQNQTIGAEYTRRFSGQAPNGIDLRTLLAPYNIPGIGRSSGFPLIGGKRYAVKVFTLPTWHEQTVLLELTGATVSVRPYADKIRDREYQRCALEPTPTLLVDTRAGSCDSRYLVSVVEVANGQELAATRFEQWIQPFTPLPDDLDVATLYRNAGFGFAIGKRYKVTVAVGFPWAADHFYVTFKRPQDCRAVQRDVQRMGF